MEETCRMEAEDSRRASRTDLREELILQEDLLVFSQCPANIFADDDYA